jgi:hypothetical protein
LQKKFGSKKVLAGSLSQSAYALLDGLAWLTSAACALICIRLATIIQVTAIFLWRIWDYLLRQINLLLINYRSNFQLFNLNHITLTI